VIARRAYRYNGALKYTHERASCRYTNTNVGTLPTLVSRLHPEVFPRDTVALVAPQASKKTHFGGAEPQSSLATLSNPRPTRAPKTAAYSPRLSHSHSKSPVPHALTRYSAWPKALLRPVETPC
jgi:hypothetical protein